MNQPKRPTESKSGKVFQTGSSPTDRPRIDLSYSYWVLGGVVSTLLISPVRMVAKAEMPREMQTMCRVRGCQGVWTFTRRNWVRVAGA